MHSLRTRTLDRANLISLSNFPAIYGIQYRLYCSSICRFDEVLTPYICVIHACDKFLAAELKLCMLYSFKLNPHYASSYKNYAYIVCNFYLIYLKCLPSSIALLMLCSYVTYQAKFSFLYCHTCIRNQSHTASSGCEESLDRRL